MEPISPELALIDPELARAHLAWLERSAEALTASEAVQRLPEAIEPQLGNRARIEPRRTGTALKIAVSLSLAVNGFLAAVVVAHDRPSPAPQSPAAAAGILIPPTPPNAPVARTTPVGTNAALEQRVLSLVIQSPRTRLPASLVDVATGLPKNGLQVVCRGGPAGSHLCLVRPAGYRPDEGIVVRYTPTENGRGTFTWSPYRSG